LDESHLASECKHQSNKNTVTFFDPLLKGLDVYIVGGAVRDELLCRPAGDRDWVVVGSTPETLIDRGFIPVGADFPVFLHPITKEEFALARTERKTGRGYKGFTFQTGPDVTLEDDLKRRDLTINAMARKPDGDLVDPLGGAKDLKSAVLRHVVPAFEEDPVRILRLARFAARFTDFSIAPDTIGLCRRMVAAGEAGALVPERVWQELSRGLVSEKPSRLFDVLAQCDALPVVMPGFEWNTLLGARLDALARSPLSGLPAMYAVALLTSADREALSVRLRASNECAQWAKLLPTVFEYCERDPEWVTPQAAEQVLALIEAADGIRRHERLVALVSIVYQLFEKPADRLLSLLIAANSVKAGDIAQPLQAAGAQAIGQAVRAARLTAIEQRLVSLKADGADQSG
jgi:tRNA nucleotidyltransferase (CCA-adding enzyme)